MALRETLSLEAPCFTPEQFTGSIHLKARDDLSQAAGDNLRCQTQRHPRKSSDTCFIYNTWGPFYFLEIPSGKLIRAYCRTRLSCDVASIRYCSATNAVCSCSKDTRRCCIANTSEWSWFTLPYFEHTIVRWHYIILRHKPILQ